MATHTVARTVSAAITTALALPLWILAGGDPTSAQQSAEAQAAAGQNQAPSSPLDVLRQRAREARAQRERLIADFEARDPTTITPREHFVAAEAYLALGKHAEAIDHARIALAELPDDPAIPAVLVLALIRNGQATEADAVFQTARERFADSESLARLRVSLGIALRRDGQLARAIEHLRIHLDQCRESLTTNPSSRTYLGAIGLLTGAMLDAGQQQQALAVVASERKTIEELARQRGEAEPAALVARLIADEARLLTDLDRAADAQSLVEAQIRGVRRRLDAQPADAQLALALAHLLRARAALEADDARRLDLDDELRAFVLKQVAAHPDSSELRSLAVELIYEAGMQAVRQARVEAARGRIDELRTLAEGAAVGEASPPAPPGGRATAARLADQLESRLTSELARAELIGRPALPLDVDAWVNGPPLTASELAGKVVLLDFWAVWCGPCIATFPHLRQWHEQYADRGLVIVGLTRYYSYGWDEKESRPLREEEITPAAERAAIGRFAAHHALPYRLAVMPQDTQLPGGYGVVGIPQVVVIDREGIVRLIRVGSGEANAADVSQLLAELLGEPAAEAASP